MMSYRVELTERAFQDLDRLLGSLAERSPEAADRLATRFHEALSRLESFPLGCPVAHESRFCTEEVRHLLFHLRKGPTYRALFVVRDDVVKVLCIRAPGERPVKPPDPDA